MIRALSNATTGLEAQQANVERVASDIANVNTDGYKRTRNEFQDLMYQTVREPGAQIGDVSQAPVGIQAGMGVKVGAQYKVFEQGPIRQTGRPFDFMVEGKGFFPVNLPNGEVAYTRTAAFVKNAQGQLQLTNGASLIPQVTIPADAMSVTVSPNGEVKAQMPNNGETILGQIQLVTFQNEEGLAAAGGNLYRPTVASGNPIQGIPTENGFGAIQQGALEGSNVNIANSMVEMIQAQRGYEMNARVISTADKMLETLVNIK